MDATAATKAGCGCGRELVALGSGKEVDGVFHRYGLPCYQIGESKRVAALLSPCAEGCSHPDHRPVLKRDDGPGPLIVDQAEPMPAGEGQPVEPVLIELIRQRTALGRKKYGTELRTRNGRDALVDALQESLDLNQYLMQRVLELQDDLAAAYDTERTWERTLGKLVGADAPASVEKLLAPVLEAAEIVIRTGASDGAVKLVDAMEAIRAAR